MKELGHHTYFTNVFIKNFGEEFSDEQLVTTFQAYGKIISARVMVDRTTGKKRGFGFVSFENHEDATAVSQPPPPPPCVC